MGTAKSTYRIFISFKFSLCQPLSSHKHVICSPQKKTKQKRLWLEQQHRRKASFLFQNVVELVLRLPAGPATIHLVLRIACCYSFSAADQRFSQTSGLTDEDENNPSKSTDWLLLVSFFFFFSFCFHCCDIITAPLAGLE